MISALIIIIGLSLLILIHELGHFLAAKYFGVKVEEFGFGFPPRLWSKEHGETVYSVNSLPFGGFVRLYGENKPLGPRSFLSQTAGRRALIIIAGVALNFLAGWFLISAIYFIGLPPAVVVNEVLAGSPGKAAGIQTGDVILNFKTAGELVDFVKEHPGEEMILEIRRLDNNLIFRLTPQPRLGLSLVDAGIPARSLGASFIAGLKTSFDLAGAVLLALATLFQAPGNVVGPVGILEIAVKTGGAGLIYLLQILALISINLAVLNILPIPALDGGRLFFIIIEKLRGRPLDFQKEARANLIGFAFLLALIVLVTVKDIIGIF